jgi:hypothetical protein
MKTTILDIMRRRVIIMNITVAAREVMRKEVIVNQVIIQMVMVRRDPLIKVTILLTTRAGRERVDMMSITDITMIMERREEKMVTALTDSAAGVTAEVVEEVMEVVVEVTTKTCYHNVVITYIVSLSCIVLLMFVSPDIIIKM